MNRSTGRAGGGGRLGATCSSKSARAPRKGARPPGAGFGCMARVCRAGGRSAAQKTIEPAHHALGVVAVVGRVAEMVALVRIDHELRLDAERLQGVPEL